MSELGIEWRDKGNAISMVERIGHIDGPRGQWELFQQHGGLRFEIRGPAGEVRILDGIAQALDNEAARLDAEAIAKEGQSA